MISLFMIQYATAATVLMFSVAVENLRIVAGIFLDVTLCLRL